MIFPALTFHFMDNSSTPLMRGNIVHGGTTRINDRPWIALSLVLCAHLALFAALSQQQPSSPLETIAQPIMVSLMSAPQTTLQKPLPAAQPVAEVQKPVKKTVKTPVNKPAVPLTKQTDRPAPPAEQTSTPADAPNSSIAEQPSKATNSKPTADAQTYQSPDFNAAYLNNPSPAYPPLSRRLGEQGLVLLLVQVTQDGAAGSVELQTGSGSSRLDRAALEAVKKWRFIPAKRGEQPVSASVVVPVRFSIEEG